MLFLRRLFQGAKKGVGKKNSTTFHFWSYFLIFWSLFGDVWSLFPRFLLAESFRGKVIVFVSKSHPTIDSEDVGDGNDGGLVAWLLSDDHSNVDLMMMMIDDDEMIDAGPLPGFAIATFFSMRGLSPSCLLNDGYFYTATRLDNVVVEPTTMRMWFVKKGVPGPNALPSRKR